MEEERKKFQKAFKLERIDGEWDEHGGYYDADIGELILCMWQGWYARSLEETHINNKREI